MIDIENGGSLVTLISIRGRLRMENSPAQRQLNVLKRYIRVITIFIKNWIS